MMKIYPFNLDIPKIMPFRDKNNNIKCLIAKKDDFKTKKILKECLVVNNIKNIIIKESYIRYYNRLPKTCEEAYLIKENEGYSFTKKGRGAQKVFVIEREK